MKMQGVSMEQKHQVKKKRKISSLLKKQGGGLRALLRAKAILDPPLSIKR